MHLYSILLVVGNFTMYAWLIVLGVISDFLFRWHQVH